MNPSQRNLLEQLLAQRSPVSPTDSRQRTPSGFVLDHGWWYSPVAKPEHIPTGIPNECFANAFRLASNNPSLVYCEGFALYDGHHSTPHAWVTDGSGNAIDNTWDKIGIAYAGVPFKFEWLDLRQLNNEAIICVLDDWQNNWPLLHECGQEPCEWLEPQGRGARRLRDM